MRILDPVMAVALLALVGCSPAPVAAPAATSVPVAATAAESAAVKTGCPLGSAVYRLPDDPERTITFVPRAEEPKIIDFDILLTSTEGKHYRFGYYVPNGYSSGMLSASAGSTRRICDECRIFFFGTDLMNIGLVGMASETAPAYIFVPDLGPSAWYSDDGGGADNITTEMWRVSECRDKPAA